MKQKIFFFQLVILIGLFALMPKVKAAELVGVEYQSHVQYIGWQNKVGSEEISGTTGQGLRVEALKISLLNQPAGMKIKYQAHVQNIGWQDWVYDGQVAGTTNQGLRVEAIKISLEGAPEGYHIQYQVHVQNIGWQNWVQDGIQAGTTGMGLRIEALKIRIVKDAAVSIKYKSHIQNIGWQNWVASEQVSGTTGQGLRLEAFSVALQDAPVDLKVKYQGYIQGKGWQAWAYDGANAGTTGEGLRVEGIRIALEGAVSDYHILYQAYVQGVGWQPWVMDGQIAGILGTGVRIEAIKVKIVKGSVTVNPKFAVDMGHNVSYDSGAVGIRKEDDLTREVGTRVVEKLQKLGYIAINCTPKNASSVTNSLEQRTDIANINEVNFFTSIHFNSGGGTGTEVWYMSQAGKKKGQDILNEIVALGYDNRGMKQAGVDGSNLFVLKNTDSPAVLVECSFVDSSADMSRYNADDLSDAIVRGLIK